MRPRTLHDTCLNLSRHRLGVGFPEKRKVLETFQPLYLESPLSLIEGGPVHPSTATGFADGSQLLDKPKYAQALFGRLQFCFHFISPLLYYRVGLGG